MKYLIVGLGNVGSDYDNTRHNIGFDIIDELASQKDASFELTNHAFKTTIKHKGRTFILLKPTTFMNLSGKAVRYWMQKEKVAQENVLILLDDLNIKLGQIRIKSKGSDGGHNGLKNITELLGNQNYARLRFGIGDNFSKGRQVNFVLGKWTNDEEMELPALIEHSTKAIIAFGTIGIGRTMSQFNIK